MKTALPAALIAPGVVVVALDWLGAASPRVLFVLAAASLIPIAWLIGEATEQAALRTGPGIGGYLNASFGNAPELIIALIAVSNGLPNVVRASLVGSVVSNLLLVLGFTLLVGRRSTIDHTSAFASVGIVALVVVLVLIPSAAGFHGDPERTSLAVLSVPFAVVLLVARVLVNRGSLRRYRRLQAEAPPAPTDGWSLRVALAILGVTTLVTAFVSESLVGSIDAFASGAHLSEFFVAAVIVAIVGNATEHGSAVLLAARGQVTLATEISLASSAQVAGFLIPVVALLSLTIDPVPLSFRPIELAGLALATLVAALVLVRRRTSSAGGAVLLGTYLAIAVSFYLAGDR